MSCCPPKEFPNFTVQEPSIILCMSNKKKRNITSLWNQSNMASHVKEAPDDSTDAVETPTWTHSVIHANVTESDNDVGWDAHVQLDSNK
jgi:hypothetical protein